MLVLPDTPAPAGQQLVEQCLQAVLALQIPHLPAGEVLSLSAGGITLLPGQQDLAEQALVAADQMLYQAKHRGKNRVCGRVAISMELVDGWQSNLVTG